MELISNSLLNKQTHYSNVSNLDEFIKLRDQDINDIFNKPITQEKKLDSINNSSEFIKYIEISKCDINSQKILDVILNKVNIDYYKFFYELIIHFNLKFTEKSVYYILNKFLLYNKLNDHNDRLIRSDVILNNYYSPYVNKDYISDVYKFVYNLYGVSLFNYCELNTPLFIDILRYNNDNKDICNLIMSFEKLKINNFYNLTLYPDFINYIIKDVDNLSNFKKTCSENLFNCIKNNYNDLIVKIIENNLFDFNYCDISGNNVYHFLFDNIKFNKSSSVINKNKTLNVIPFTPTPSIHSNLKPINELDVDIDKDKKVNEQLIINLFMDNINNEVINKCNKFGYYPIHILVENICKLFEKKQNNYVNSDNVNSDKINDFVNSLIGVVLFNVKDMFGNTPLNYILNLDGDTNFESIVINYINNIKIEYSDHLFSFVKFYRNIYKSFNKGFVEKIKGIILVCLENNTNICDHNNLLFRSFLEDFNLLFINSLFNNKAFNKSSVLEFVDNNLNSLKTNNNLPNISDVCYFNYMKSHNISFLLYIKNILTNNSNSSSINDNNISSWGFLRW